MKKNICPYVLLFIFMLWHSRTDFLWLCTNWKKRLALYKFPCVASNYCLLFMKANRLKIFKIIDRSNVLHFSSCVCSAKWIYLLYSSLLTMIIVPVGWWLVGRWVGGLVGKWSVVGWSVVHGFNKIHSKHVLHVYK